MTDSLKREPVVDVIEMAMSRLAQRLPESAGAEDAREQRKLDLGRRAYDTALADRLEQARTTAQGAPAMSPAPAPEPPAQRPCCSQTGMLFAFMLLAVAAGAGVTWLAVFADQHHVATPAPIQPIAKPAPLPPVVVAAASVVAAPEPSDEARVRELVETWRAAWAWRDVDAYLACYGADFTPANGQARAAWETARRKNIATRSSIAVATNDLTLERIDARRMKARFLQDYSSDKYRETAQPKTLLLVRGDAGWKIAGEWQGEAPAGALGSL